MFGMDDELVNDCRDEDRFDVASSASHQKLCNGLEVGVDCSWVQGIRTLLSRRLRLAEVDQRSTTSVTLGGFCSQMLVKYSTESVIHV